VGIVLLSVFIIKLLIWTMTDITVVLPGKWGQVRLGQSAGLVGAPTHFVVDLVVLSSKLN